MKSAEMAKIFGIALIVVGLLFAILGTIEYIATQEEAEDRIYTTANIVKIDMRRTSDPHDPVDCTTYVEIEVEGKTITAKLDTYKSSFEIGQQIDVYYFENDTQMIYQVGSDVFYIIFASAGLVFAAVGVIIWKLGQKHSA